MEISMENLITVYCKIREDSQNLCKPLYTDDYNIQPRAEVSPPKWHLAHTTWFFESFILKEHLEDYKTYHPKFDYLFNSYYKGHGDHWLQSQRSLLSRPTVEEIYKYRAYVDEHVIKLLEKPISQELKHLFTVGLNHEQQHQELLLMDIKAILGSQPLKPQYAPNDYVSTDSCDDIQWLSHKVDKPVSIGAPADVFSYDNERPQFFHYLNSFSIADRFVTNREYKEFITDGGYKSSQLWLSQGWDWIQDQQIKAPPYWSDDLNKEFTLYGEINLEPNAPVCHISYYEADAYAKWCGSRLPTEFELEFHLKNCKNSTDESGLHSFNPYQLNLWSWTSSHYSAYPGFKEFNGKLSEYNGKFMCNQFVLKGGCFATPKGHIRPSYRNFFAPQQRWMFSGITLAKDEL